MSRASAALVACVTAFVLAACSGMPTSGPVRTVEDPVDDSEQVTSAAYDPAPPRPGDTAADVVSGFLEAMKAIPVRTSVARQYLSADAKSRWDPSREVITYESVGMPEGESTFTVPMTRAGSYDSAGAWSGWRTGAGLALSFTVVKEKGQWRIQSLPDALVVPSSWFSTQYRRVSRYYLDPTNTVLTPQSVFVPRGDQLSTLLVKGLVQPQSARWDGVTVSAVPATVNAGLSVPVSSAGVAQVDLYGQAPSFTTADRERMAAQLVWTLRQDSRVRALRVTVDGRQLPGATDLPMNGGSQFSPTGFTADPALFGVRGRSLVRGRFGDLTEQGSATPSLQTASELAVNPSGVWSAVVNHDRDQVQVSRIGVDEPASQVSGSGLLRPAWDLQNRLWLVDGGAHARIRVRQADGKVSEVQVPSASGAQVRQLLVSRDGTRLVTLVRRGNEDRAYVSLVRQDSDGRVLSVGAADQLWFGNSPPRQIHSLAWQGVTGVAALSQVSFDLAQVRVAGVDGAPVEYSAPVLVRGRGQGLLGTPADATRVLVLTERGVVDSSSQLVVARTVAEDRLLGFTG